MMPRVRLVHSTVVLHGYVCDLSEIAAADFGKSNCNSFLIVSSELVRRINKALDPVPQTDDKRTNNQGRESLNTAQYFVVRQTSIQSNSLWYIQQSSLTKRNILSPNCSFKQATNNICFRVIFCFRGICKLKTP